MPTPLPDQARAAQLERDLRTLVRFIEIYCKGKHPQDLRKPVNLKTHDVVTLAGHEVSLCPECQKLVTHALVKRSTCPMDPKPACKHCPNHCYHPTYRQKIREVMKYSGKRMLLTARLDYLIHYFF